VPERISNGGSEAINLLIEMVRRLAHGFRPFDQYRLRILLTASGTRTYRRAPPFTDPKSRFSTQVVGAS